MGRNAMVAESTRNGRCGSGETIGGETCPFGVPGALRPSRLSFRNLANLLFVSDWRGGQAGRRGSGDPAGLIGDVLGG